MKNILLISDTHGYLDDRIIKYVREADEVWHAGDVGSVEVLDNLKDLKPLKAVYGNIDGTEIRQELSKDLIFSVEGIKVFMTHIGGYPPKYKPGIIDRLKEFQPDVFICGHSHILKVIRDKNLNILHLNPGACGNKGFHRIRTMIRFKIMYGKMQDLEVIELGNR